VLTLPVKASGGITGKLQGQQLQGNFTPELAVSGTKHFPHAAFANECLNL
jgi:hypothetical protein